MPERMDDAAVREWVVKIVAVWRTILKDIIRTGQLLIEAKKSLPYKQWLPMVKGELPFGPRTAQRLMAIASDPRITDAAHESLLPPCWATLYLLTKLSNGAFQLAIDRKLIHPEMQRADAEALVRLQYYVPKSEDADGDDERPDNPDPIDEARNVYFALGKKLSGIERVRELHRCVAIFGPTNEDWLIARRAKQKDASASEIGLAEAVNSIEAMRAKREAAEEQELMNAESINPLLDEE